MLCLILSNYIAPLEALDRVLPVHRAHLDAYYTSGRFLIPGSFLPREGGGVLTRVGSREEIDTIAARDPFVIGNLVQARVIAWGPSHRSTGVPRTWLPDVVVATST